MTRLTRFLLSAFRAVAGVVDPGAGFAQASGRMPFPRSGFGRALSAALAACFAATAALAQSISWDPPAGSLARGPDIPDQPVFEDCAPTSDEVQLPVVDGLQFGRPSVSNQTSIINFKTSRRVILAYPAMPTATSGRIVIPEFEIDTDSGKQRVAAATYDLGEATVGRSNVPIERVAGSRLAAEPTTVWAGQVFDLQYQLLISRRYNPTNVGPLDWTPSASLFLEPWPQKPEMINATVGGDARVGIATKTRAFIRDPGTHTLPVARQPIDLASGGGFSFFDPRPNTEQYLITSSAPTVQVKPLPAPAPSSFMGAVGQFTFTSKVVPTTAAVGEPITWTLALEGTGNWPAGLNLPAREASKDFHAFAPNTQRKTKDGTLFEGSLTEDIVLMPTKPGTYTLGSVSYSYFDPAAGTYKTVRTESVKVTVTAASQPAAGNATAGGAAPIFQFTPDNASTSAASSSPVVKSPSPELPGHLPMEPLAGHASAPRPWVRIPLSALLAPLAPLLLLWFALGWRRARLTDPRREQRLALASLAGAVAAVQYATDPAARAEALRRWQQLAARAWGSDHAAPTPEQFTESVWHELSEAGADSVATWTKLWTEADAHLYGRSTALPADWAARAATALGKARLRRQSLFAAIRPSALWPLPLVALALLVAVPRAEAAGAAEERYLAGEFANAEQTWRAGLAVTPDDWKLRHNLGLAIAQQNRWSEAAAQWSVAFLAAPRDPSVRWHLALGLERAEFTQPELSALSSGAGLAGFARHASPTEWQRIILAGVALLALAAAAVLVARHFPRHRWLNWVAAALAIAGVLSLASGLAALREYGPIAHPDAVLVWKATELRSLPTEAGEQKPEPLAAGTIAIWQKSFLGWDQLLFSNGQTGWTRRDNLQPLYPEKWNR